MISPFFFEKMKRYLLLIALIAYVLSTCRPPYNTFKTNFPFQQADSLVIWYKVPDQNDHGALSVHETNNDSIKEVTRLMGSEADPRSNKDLINRFYKDTSFSDVKTMAELYAKFPVAEKDEEVKRYMCSPIYRDIIIYYKNGTPFSAVKICFSCNHMRFYGDSSAAVSEKYDALKFFWKQHGIKTDKDFQD
jgi:hypothetical protein